MRLSDITDYLVSVKYAKVRDYQEGVAEFMDVLDKCSADVFTILHARHAAAQAITAPAQLAAPVRPTAKPSTAELNPVKLAHDASMVNFREWKKQFRAYYDAAHLGSLPCTQQQAYINNCLDEMLCAQVDREATGTTPIYCVSCVSLYLLHEDMGHP